MGPSGIFIIDEEEREYVILRIGYPEEISFVVFDFIYKKLQFYECWR